MMMPFGKYRGRAVEALPADYLQWLANNVKLRPPLDAAVLAALNGHNVDQAVETLDTKGVKAVYRRLSLKYHPDRGGNNLAQAAINEFYEALRKENGQ